MSNFCTLYSVIKNKKKIEEWKKLDTRMRLNHSFFKLFPEIFEVFGVVAKKTRCTPKLRFHLKVIPELESFCFHFSKLNIVFLTMGLHSLTSVK